VESAPNPIVVIVGQTASGKSALGMKLAQQSVGSRGGEILCADSRTIYRELDIGTAKPSAQDRAMVPHHGLDLINLNERYSAAAFQCYGQAVIKDIHARGKLPIMVGGTGLYIDGLLYNFSFNTSDSTSKTNTTNSFDSTSTFNASEARVPTRQPLPPNVLIIGLKVDKELLHQRIAERVDTMFEDGLLDEVQKVINVYGHDSNLPGLLAPGYKAVLQYIDGKLTLSEAKQLFIRNDMGLAKRQMTWFKRNSDIKWCTTEHQAYDNVRAFLQDFATIDT